MAIEKPKHRNTRDKESTPGLIPDAFLALVNEKADILGVIERSVKLKKSGVNNWLGLCPFHKEKGPSFTVTPSKGMYYCFGCGASGGAITFLMEHDGTPFREAVKELALNAGIPLPNELLEDGQSTTVPSNTQPLYQAMDLASKYFQNVLRHEKTTRDYIKTRGITVDSVMKFQIGAAPDEWKGLKEAFPDYAENPHIIINGLVREKASSEAVEKVHRFDNFRARLMFPVRDMRGRIVAFGGRLLKGGEPKYLNSPESPIFSKSGSLYGLFEARESIRQKKLAIVVEGYIDVVMLSQHGIENVVSCMGTSMTRSHIERLLTQSEVIAFAFDGDAAGRKAAWRSMLTCLPLIEDTHDIRFLILPQGKDPDDLALEEGSVAFEERVRTAPSMSEFMLGELVLKHNNLNSTEDRARFAVEGYQVAGKLRFGTKIRGLLLQRISAESRVPGSVIKSLQRASVSRPGIKTLWSTLTRAAIVAPALAIEDRDLLLELLDLECDQEKAFSETLLSLTIDDVIQIDQASEAAWLLARDTLKSAVDIITEHREQQMKNEVRMQFQSGAITESEYMRLSMSGG